MRAKPRAIAELAFDDLRGELRAEIRQGGGLPEPGSRRCAARVPRLPGQHWKHLRTTNPIESTFATVRHRTILIEGSPPVDTGPRSLNGLQTAREARQKPWRRLDGHNQLPKLILGVTFNDGIEIARETISAA